MIVMAVMVNEYGGSSGWMIVMAVIVDDCGDCDDNGDKKMVDFFENKNKIKNLTTKFSTDHLRNVDCCFVVNFLSRL